MTSTKTENYIYIGAWDILVGFFLCLGIFKLVFCSRFHDYWSSRIRFLVVYRGSVDLSGSQLSLMIDYWSWNKTRLSDVQFNYSKITPRTNDGWMFFFLRGRYEGPAASYWWYWCSSSSSVAPTLYSTLFQTLRLHGCWHTAHIVYKQSSKFKLFYLSLLQEQRDNTASLEIWNTEINKIRLYSIKCNPQLVRASL